MKKRKVTLDTYMTCPVLDGRPTFKVSTCVKRQLRNRHGVFVTWGECRLGDKPCPHGEETLKLLDPKELKAVSPRLRKAVSTCRAEGCENTNLAHTGYCLGHHVSHEARAKRVMRPEAPHMEAAG